MLKYITQSLVIVLCCTTLLFAGKTYSRGSSSSSGKSYSSGSKSSFSSSKSYSSPVRSTPHVSTHSYSPHVTTHSTTTRSTSSYPRTTSSSNHVTHTTVNHYNSRPYYSGSHHSYVPIIIPWVSNTHTVVREHPTVPNAYVEHVVEYQFSWTRTIFLILIIAVITAFAVRLYNQNK